MRGGNEQGMASGKITSLWRVHAALLLAQLFSGGYYVVTKVALVHGMNRIVLSLYRDILALVILFPAALIFERGVSRAKLAGIVLCCGGALFMALYRGPAVLGRFNPDVLGEPDPLHVKLEYASHFNGFGIDDWRLGAVCLVGNCLCIASFINLQAPLLKRFPAPISVVAYSYLFGALIMGAASYFLVHDSSAWIVGWNVDLLAILYNGIISSALNFGLMAWALSKVGPLFVASYIPVQPISSTVLALIFLNSIVYLGCVLGTVLIILGLFLVSWAREQSAELAILSEIVEHSSRFSRVTAEALTGLRAPLLQA